MGNLDKNKKGSAEIFKPKKIAGVPKIIQHDDASGKNVLREVAKKISLTDIKTSKIQRVISDIRMALESQSDGVALSAPQINVSLRIFVVHSFVYDTPETIKIKTPKTKKLRTVFINPEIIKISKDRKKMDEGCLSVRNWYGKVRRSSRVTIKSLDENGEEFTIEGSGLLAQIFQHEIDHLDGILFIDKATSLRKLSNGKLNKAAKKLN